MTMTNTPENRLISLLRDGRPLLGLYHGFPAEAILETIGPGWDFVWIDGQHGQFSIDAALRSVRTASTMGLETVLRAPSHDAGWLGVYADTAASALMIPQIDSPQMAMATVEALRFPPHGRRSFGGRRTVDVHGRDYYRHRQPAVVVQIESREALENVRRIASVDGVDGLFFGADDLKLSLGLPIDAKLCESDELISAQRTIAEAARAAGKWCGQPALAAEDLRTAIELGYQLISCGGDVSFVRAGARETLAESRRVMEASRANQSFKVEENK